MPQSEEFVHPFAEVALSNITREYPYTAHHVAQSSADIVEPREKNPAFANSFDWHSRVHRHFLLVSLLSTETAQTASRRDEALDTLAGLWHDFYPSWILSSREVNQTLSSVP